jgi:hypothetical protein
VEDHTSSYPDSSPAIISLTSQITLSCRLLGIHMRLSKRQRHTHALDDFRRGSPSGGDKTDEQLKNTSAINLGPAAQEETSYVCGFFVSEDSLHIWQSKVPGVDARN